MPASSANGCWSRTASLLASPVMWIPMVGIISRSPRCGSAVETPDAARSTSADCTPVVAPHPPADPAGLGFQAEVAQLRAGERRRLFPLALHVGVPDGARRGVELAWPVPHEYDAGLRFDV